MWTLLRKLSNHGCPHSSRVKFRRGIKNFHIVAQYCLLIENVIRLRSQWWHPRNRCRLKCADPTAGSWLLWLLPERIFNCTCFVAPSWLCCVNGRIKAVFQNFQNQRECVQKGAKSISESNKWLLIPMALCSIFAILFGLPSLPERGFLHESWLLACDCAGC